MQPAPFMKRLRVAGIGIAAMVTAWTVASASAALVAHWRLDEIAGTTASDASGNARHGTLTDGGTWDAGGVFNGALRLDGLNDRVHVPSTADLKYTGGNLTLSTWVYRSATDDASSWMISKPWHGYGAYNYYLRLTDSGANTAVTLFVSSPGIPGPPVVKPAASAAISSPSYLSFREGWHHIAGVLDSSRNMTLYVDGNRAASGVHAITDWEGTDWNTSLALGTYYPYSAGWAGRTDFCLDGKLDDAAIWNEALDAAHARSLYTVPRNLGLAYDVADMIGLWGIHSLGPGGSGTVDGTFWQFTNDLPDIAPGTRPSGGDAYVNGTFLYIALGNGTGLVHLPEPSTLVLAALGLLGLGFLGRRPRARRPAA